jgi:hypothetical protein
MHVLWTKKWTERKGIRTLGFGVAWSVKLSVFQSVIWCSAFSPQRLSVLFWHGSTFFGGRKCPVALLLVNQGNFSLNYRDILG